MEITFKKTEAGFAIVAGGVEVGTIEKGTEEIERPIKGTTLRHAKGKTVTRFRVTIARRHFVAAPLTLGTGLGPLRSAKAAKEAVVEALAGLTLKA